MSNAVLVAGSANQDIIVTAPRIPLVGETILGEDVSYLPGGKGLNQACASGSTGSTTIFLGAVGQDPSGNHLLETLRHNNVDTSRVARIPDVQSGTAHIVVSSEGGNQIVVAPGANGQVSASYVLEEMGRRPDVNVLVLQGEIPHETNLAAAVVAESLGIRVIFNLAPAGPVPAQLIELADPLVVNEFEAAILLKASAPQTQDDAMMAAKELARRCRSVIITLGEAGGVVGTEQTFTFLEPHVMSHVVDTTGAGDAFVGVLAAELSQKNDLLSAASRATHASALTVARPGAAASYGVIRDLYLQGSMTK